jgi:chemotaxis protein CheC
MTGSITDRSASETKNVTEIDSLTPDKGGDLEIFLELGSIGAGNAATSLSEIFQEPILIEVPKIHTLPPHLVPNFYKKHDTPTTAIYMQLRGEAECDILLMFEVEEARKIAAMMTMAPSPEDVDPEMEASAIEELGSIMIGGFLSAIADFTDVELLPLPPLLVKGCFDAILDSFLVKQSLVSDIALVFDGCFRRSSNQAGGTIIVFPSPEMQKVLVNKSQEWLSRQ